MSYRDITEGRHGATQADDPVNIGGVFQTPELAHKYMQKNNVAYRIYDEGGSVRLYPIWEYWLLGKDKPRDIWQVIGKTLDTTRAGAEWQFRHFAIMKPSTIRKVVCAETEGKQMKNILHHES